jgi:hypothetical protein
MNKIISENAFQEECMEVRFMPVYYTVGKGYGDLKSRIAKQQDALYIRALSNIKNLAIQRMSLKKFNMESYFEPFAERSYNHFGKLFQMLILNSLRTENQKQKAVRVCTAFCF